jgi:hypothetical protein
MKRSQIHLFIAITLFFIATNTMAQVANSQPLKKEIGYCPLFNYRNIFS